MMVDGLGIHGRSFCTFTMSKELGMLGAPGDEVLVAKDLVKEYGQGSARRTALNGVSLTVTRGRFLSVMGPSGSGKSTLLHVLGGLDTPTSGDVWLDGQTLSDLGDRELTLLRRRRIGFVFQAFNLVPVLSVEENVALPAIIAGEKESSYRTRVATLLDLVGLTAQRQQVPSELSGGEQQRVAIARALFIEPAVLLADEPTGNLDSHTGADVVGLLQQARDNLGTTVVMVTHDPRMAAMADEAMFLRDGALAGRLDVNGGDDRSQLVLAWLQELGA
jgi:putative ABC transport system ATP-binding protein